MLPAQGRNILNIDFKKLFTFDGVQPKKTVPVPLNDMLIKVDELIIVSEKGYSRSRLYNDMMCFTFVLTVSTFKIQIIVTFLMASPKTK